MIKTISRFNSMSFRIVFAPFNCTIILGKVQYLPISRRLPGARKDPTSSFPFMQYTYQTESAIQIRIPENSTIEYLLKFPVKVQGHIWKSSQRVHITNAQINIAYVWYNTRYICVYIILPFLRTSKRSQTRDYYNSTVIVVGYYTISSKWAVQM